MFDFFYLLQFQKSWTVVKEYEVVSNQSLQNICQFQMSQEIIPHKEVNLQTLVTRAPPGCDHGVYQQKQTQDMMIKLWAQHQVFGV